MNATKPFAAVLLISLFAPCGGAQENAEEKAIELPADTMPPRRAFPEKTGEDIPAHKLGPWRWYKPNPLTYKERKTRPFWALTEYHGGWYHGKGYQPSRGGFHMANPFGVWEHDPVTDRLVFQFEWPFHLACRYDPAGDCYWGMYGIRVLNFTLGDGGRPENIRVHRTNVRPPLSLRRYQFTDERGRAWFHGCWLERDGDRLLLHLGEPERLIRLSWKQARQTSKPLYRREEHHLQKFESGKWRDAVPPPGARGTTRGVAQRGPAVLVATDGGAAEWYPRYGLSFQLTDESTQWIAFDREGRKWLAPGLCLDDTGPPTTPPQFYAALPRVLDNDPIAAGDAMRCLLRAGDNYPAWIQAYAAVGNFDPTAAGNALRRLGDKYPAWLQAYAAVGRSAFSNFAPVVAGNALRRLLRADANDPAWFQAYAAVGKAAFSNLIDPQVKKAALLLSACLEGKRTLRFTGDRVRLERLLAGKGTAPDPLPIPEQNRPPKFVETDPLILDTTAAGALADYRLVETPLLEHPGYRFQGGGKTLINRNARLPYYFKISHADGEIKLTPAPESPRILLASASRDPAELLVLVCDAQRRLAAGVLEIETGKFQKRGEIQQTEKPRQPGLPIVAYVGGELARDADGRLLLVANKGRAVYYQREPGGEFEKREVARPFMPYKGGVLYDGKGRIFVYQSQFERQWEGEFSEVFEFKDGELRRIGDTYRGHIYHMLALSDKVLLAATKSPHGFLFIDNETGAMLSAPFDPAAPITSRHYYLNSWCRDGRGRLWLYSTWPPNNNGECGRVQLWDGETLKTVVDWRFPTTHPPLNPVGGCMCITDDGRVWVGVEQRLLIIDSKTLDYRFFRAPDRKGAPSLLLSSGDWVAANYGPYGKNTTAFQLQPSNDAKK